MKLAIAVKGPVIKYKGGGGGWGIYIYIFLSTGFPRGPPLSCLTKLGWPTPGVAQKKLVTYPPTKPVTLMWIGTLGNIGLPLLSEPPKKSSRSKCE